MKSHRYSSAFLILVVFVAVGVLPAVSQIQVTSTNPSAAAQGTTNLNVEGMAINSGNSKRWGSSGKGRAPSSREKRLPQSP